MPGCAGSPPTGLAGGGGGQPRWPAGRADIQQQAHPPALTARGGWVPQRRAAEAAPTGIGVTVGAMSPIQRNVIWAMDFQFDTTADGPR